MRQSPFLLIKDLEKQIIGRLAGVDVQSVSLPERKLVEALRRQIVDVRLDIRDYELSETRGEQLDNAKQAVSRLINIRKDILTLSEYGIFSAADVAQLTAQLDQIAERIE